MNSNTLKQTERPEVSTRYRHYVLGILTLVYIFNLVDRSILSILQESIKIELGLTDTQLGALTGLAFALFYATLAIPIARVADKSVRKIVVSVSLAVWSLMTALCGTAQGFLSLLLFRIGVGVGEAGGVPPSVSLISDYFPPSKRATAMAIYGFGPPLGIMLGVFAGGWVTEYLGWRYAFYAVGIAGLLLAPVVMFTVRELPRGFSDPGQSSEVEAPPLKRVVAILWRLRSFRHLALAGTAHAFASYSLISWNPSFYMRVHELSPSETGTFIGLMAGIAGGLGTFLGGYFADRLGAKNTRWYMLLPAVALAVSVPVAIAQYLALSTSVSLAIAAVSYFLASVYIGPFIGTAQSLVIPSMRATTQAVILLIFNILGLSLGPLLTGVLSDYLNISQGMGVDSLRYSLSVAVLFNLWAAVHFYLGSKHLDADMKRDRSSEEREVASAA
jgi:MFS family permease